jgi:hypothetical protein
MPAPPLAHLGHWYVSLPVFMGPVLLLALALKLQTWRERRRGPDRSGKRSSVTMIAEEDHSKATIAVTGPLDLPALLEIEAELGKTAHTTPEIVLDLHRVTTADERAALGLCDAIGRACTDQHISALIESEPAMHALRTICAAEGVDLVDEVAVDQQP